MSNQDILLHIIKQTLKHIETSSVDRWYILYKNNKHIDVFPFTNTKIEDFMNIAIKKWLQIKQRSTNDIDLANYKLINKKYHNVRYYVYNSNNAMNISNNNISRNNIRIRLDELIDDVLYMLQNDPSLLKLDNLRLDLSEDPDETLKLIYKNYNPEDNDNIIAYLTIIRLDQYKPLKGFPRPNSYNTVSKLEHRFNLNNVPEGDKILYIKNDSFSLISSSHETIVSKKNKNDKNTLGRCTKYISSSDIFYNDKGVFVINVKNDIKNDILQELSKASLNVLQFNVNRIKELDGLFLMLNRYMGLSLISNPATVLCMQEVNYQNIHEGFNHYEFRYVECELSHSPASFHFISGKKKGNISSHDAREAVIPFENFKDRKTGGNVPELRKRTRGIQGSSRATKAQKQTQQTQPTAQQSHYQSYDTALLVSVSYQDFKKLLPQKDIVNSIMPWAKYNPNHTMYNDHTYNFNGKRGDNEYYNPQLDENNINKALHLIYKLSIINTNNCFLQDATKIQYFNELKDINNKLIFTTGLTYGDCLIIYFIDSVTSSFEEFKNFIDSNRSSPYHPEFVELLYKIPKQDLEFYGFVEELVKLFESEDYKRITEENPGSQDFKKLTLDRKVEIIRQILGYASTKEFDKKTIDRHLSVHQTKRDKRQTFLIEYDINQIVEQWRHKHLHKLFLKELHKAWNSNNTLKNDGRGRAHVFKFFLNENPYIDNGILKNRKKEDPMEDKYSNYLPPKEHNENVEPPNFSLIERIHYSLMTVPNINLYNTLEHKAHILVNKLGLEKEIYCKNKDPNRIAHNPSLIKFYEKAVVEYDDVEINTEWWYVYCSSRINYSSISNTKDLMIIFPTQFYNPTLNNNSHIFLGLLSENINVYSNKDTHAYLAIKSNDNKTAIVNIHLESGSSDDDSDKAVEELIILMRAIGKNSFFDPCENIYIFGDFNLNSKVIAKTLNNLKKKLKDMTIKIVLNSFITYQGLEKGNCIDNCIHLSRSDKQHNVKSFIGINRDSDIYDIQRMNSIVQFNGTNDIVAASLTQNGTPKRFEDVMNQEQETAPIKNCETTAKAKTTAKEDFKKTFQKIFLSDHSPVLFSFSPK